MNHFILKYPLPFGRQKTIERKAAENWNELSSSQLIKVLKLIIEANDVYQFRLKIIKLLLNLNWFQMMCYNSVELIELAQYFRWIEDKIDRTIPPLSKIKGYYAPPNRLSGLTALEFYLTDNYYREYLNGDETALDPLIACLYRSRKMKWIKPGEDPRQDFDPLTINTRAKKISRLSKIKKLAVLRFFESCRQHWELQFDNVFKGAKESGGSFGWPEVFIKMAETGVFGTESEVQNTPIANIFLKMEIDIKDYEQFRLKNQSS